MVSEKALRRIASVLTQNRFESAATALASELAMTLTAIWRLSENLVVPKVTTEPEKAIRI